ncbi:cobalamin biosynthesis protein, partial [Nocardia acidivorans]|uniref:cobalamin biosynthesis protein n=1 Tax=Nocardia acidivorans TaxID=404580 RepID=UPI00157DC11F
MDRGVGDPRRGHPVAGFGTAAMELENITYRDNRSAGVVHEIALVGGVVVVGAAARRVIRAGSSAGASSAMAWGGRRDRRGASGRGGMRGRGALVRGLCEIALTAAATWTVLGGTTLARTGREMADLLEAGDIAAARDLLPALCGRDPSLLDADGLARAALESIAENTSDATVAPLFWGALAGVPGLLGYRAVNTLDAMVGYRNERYHRFGWAAARTDDVANLGPARVAGLITTALAP